MGLAVEDVLQKWTTEAAGLYVSTEVLLESLLAQIASNNPGEGVPVTAPDNRFENMKRLIDTFLLAAKRINNPPLPIEVWTQKTNVPYDEFCKVFPFAPAWVQCLPVAFQGIFSLSDFNFCMNESLLVQSSPSLSSSKASTSCTACGLSLCVSHWRAL